MARTVLVGLAAVLVVVAVLVYLAGAGRFGAHEGPGAVTESPRPAAAVEASERAVADAAGEVEEVRGDGVVGQQPRLAEGEVFEYTSGAILKSPVGAMQGSYEFSDDDGNLFEVPIEPFSLSMPNMVH